MEEWRSIEGFPEYSISNYGNIKKGRKILRPKVNKKGFSSTIKFYSKGMIKNFRIKCLVAHLFLDNPYNRKHVKQKDGDILNNHISNLEWCCVRPKKIKHGIKGNSPEYGKMARTCKFYDISREEYLENKEKYPMSNKLGPKQGGWGKYKPSSYKPKSPEYRKDLYLQSLYGITLEDYNEMFEKQKGVCKICEEPSTNKHQSGTIKTLSVDHDHETGEVRGLLCHNCNVSVGLLKEKSKNALSLAKYLETFGK